MRKVELRINKQLKYETIKELVDHNGNKNRVAKKILLIKKKNNHFIIIYKKKDRGDFVHDNRTHKSFNSLDKSISERIILLYESKYQD